MITVMNMHLAKLDDTHIYVGRPHPLGNPYPIEKEPGNREEQRASVIEKYDRWLMHYVAEGRPGEGIEYARDAKSIIWWMDHLTKLAGQGDLALVCWCAPKPCHADIIKRIIEGRLAS